MSETSPAAPRDCSRAFFFDIAKEDFTDMQSNLERRYPDPEQREFLLDVFGRGMELNILVNLPTMMATYCKVPPGGTVKPHRHGCNQITFITKGALHYGTKVLSPGMGRFGPDKVYSWTAGPEGCEFLEVMDQPVRTLTPDGGHRKFEKGPQEIG